MYWAKTWTRLKYSNIATQCCYIVHAHNFSLVSIKIVNVLKLTLFRDLLKWIKISFFPPSAFSFFLACDCYLLSLCESLPLATWSKEFWEIACALELLYLSFPPWVQFLHIEPACNWLCVLHRTNRFFSLLQKQVCPIMLCFSAHYSRHVLFLSVALKQLHTHPFLTKIWDKQIFPDGISQCSPNNMIVFPTIC